MDAQYPSAPELPGKHTGQYDIDTAKPVAETNEPEEPPMAAPAEPEQPKLQLIHSTKPTPAAEPEEALADEEDDGLNEHVLQPGDPDGVVAAENPIEQPENQLSPQVDVPRKRRWPKVLLALIIIAALAAVAYWFGNRRVAAPGAATTSSSSQRPAAASTGAPVATKQYDSSTYTLSFDYPENWTVSDTSAKLTVTSPAMSLTGVDGKTVQGYVVVSMQNPQTTIAGYPAGGASAVLISDKLTYKQPTAVQRAQTYLSYLSYSNANGLSALYITGDNGYQQGQTIPLNDVVKGNPLISVTFETCPSDGCNGSAGTPVVLQASSWKNTSVSKQIVSLLESLQLN